MVPDDAQGGRSETPDGLDRPQDAVVQKQRSLPDAPLPDPTLRMVGFLGDSDRDARRRLYFNRDLDYYAEFHAEDVLEMSDKPADAAPFIGEQGTVVTLHRGATVEFTRVRSGRPIDEYDLDVRVLKEGFGRAVDLAAGCTPVFGSTCGPTSAASCETCAYVCG